MAFDVGIEDDRWSAAGLEALADRAFGAVAAAHGWGEGLYEAALLGCDDARIAALNAQFREKPAATNVLSWPALAYDAPTYLPKDPELGDIAIAYETCAREAADQGKPFEHHVSHLLVHGLLHLVGYDHETEQDAARMEAKEREILAKLGIADPYR
jgi:probable rRNA maturation factor